MNPSASHPSEEMYCPGCENTFYGVDHCPNDGAKLVRLVSQPDQLLGRTFDGRYTIVEKLGEGGMGSVYRSRQHSFGREVAIKVVNPGLVTDPMIIKRFLREAKLSSRLSHPNAVAVLDFGQTDDGIFYLVMELVNGRTLHDAMSETPQFTPERVVRIGTQICDALECAHDLGIVHRDLKPSNVMLLTSGRDLVKVLDFGLAKSLAVDDRGTTMTGTRGGLMGTPAFVAPELALGRPCDHRADLYSLGCILYLIGSGWPPFSAENGAELISKHAYEQPTLMPNTPPALAAVVMRLLAKAPHDRFGSSAETRQALEDALSMPHAALRVSLPAMVENPSWRRAERATSMAMTDEEAPLMLTDDVTSVSVRAESPTRIVHQRRGRVVPVLATVLLLALVGLGTAYWQSQRDPDEDNPSGIRVQQILPDAGRDPAASRDIDAVPIDAVADAPAPDAGVIVDAGLDTVTEPVSGVTVEVSSPTIIDRSWRGRNVRRKRRADGADPAVGAEPSIRPVPLEGGVVPSVGEPDESPFASPYRPDPPSVDGPGPKPGVPKDGGTAGSNGAGNAPKEPSSATGNGAKTEPKNAAGGAAKDAGGTAKDADPPPTTEKPARPVEPPADFP
jgi:serine/threonine protein kinase